MYDTDAGDQGEIFVGARLVLARLWGKFFKLRATTRVAPTVVIK
jgi:hypothetical protein